MSVSLQGTDLSSTAMHLLILLSLVVCAGGVTIHENVVFQKVNEITTTRARWLVTFVHDLEPFSYFLERVNADILRADSVARTLPGHFLKPQQQGFRATIMYMLQELQTLKDTQESIISSYKDYKALGGRSERSKRSLLPIGGRILSFLFGTLSESDLDDVRRAVNTISRQQQSLIHILEEQMTILNMSRMQISENRQAIIDLVECMDIFEIRLRNLTIEIQARFNRIEMFTNLYAQMDLILADIRDAIQRGTLYLQNL